MAFEQECLRLVQDQYGACSAILLSSGEEPEQDDDAFFKFRSRAEWQDLGTWFWHCFKEQQERKLPLAMQVKLAAVDARGFVFGWVQFRPMAGRKDKSEPFGVTATPGWQRRRRLCLLRPGEEPIIDYNIQSFDPSELRSREILESIAQWQSVVPGFCRNGDDHTVHQVIEPFLGRLRQRGIKYHMFEDGGLSNYCAVFLHDGAGASAGADVGGMTIYFSLCAPIVVYGRSASTIMSDFWSWGYLSLAEVEATSFAPNSWQSGVVAELKTTPYQVPDIGILATKLPAGIVPYEYCLGADADENRVFNVLFANTD